jgi:hypothetical protein
VSDLVMAFPAQVCGSEASVMIDFGASCNVISAAYAKFITLNINFPDQNHVSIKRADGRSVSQVGSAMIDIVIVSPGEVHWCTVFGIRL